MRKAELFFRAGWLAAAAAGLALGLAACGSGDKSPTSSSIHAHSAKKVKKNAVAKPGEEDPADMVAAVSSSKATTSVEVRFVLPTRPQIAQEMDLDVAVIPRAPLPDSLAVSFSAGEGLDIVDGAQLERVDKVVEGVPLRHVVKVLPKRDGIFAITAVVSFVQADQELARSFSIPVIAGEGMPEQVAKGR